MHFLINSIAARFVSTRAAWWQRVGRALSSTYGFAFARLSTLRWIVAAACALCSVGAHAQLRYAGSDTLDPVIEAAQAAYARGHAGFKIQMQATGTSPGLRELCTLRAALVGASRPIKSDEAQACAAASVQYVELPVALDAVGVVVSTKNTWLKDLTLGEAKALFDPASAGKIVSWKQVRNSFPDLPIRAAGVGIKHGTFGFFSEGLGLKGFIRSDFKDFADHASVGRYVAADAGAVGFMPTGEAHSLDGQVRIVPLDLGAGPVMPGHDEIASGKYDKLSHIVYFYMNPALLAKSAPSDIDFARVLVADMEKFVRYANLEPLRPIQYQENMRRMPIAR